MLKSFKIIAVCLLLVFLLSSCGVWEVSENTGPKMPKELPTEFDTLGEVWGLLEGNYVNHDALNTVKLSEGAINGMLEALGDPYTTYLDPNSFKLMSSSLFEGKFEGIGAAVGMKDGQIVVIAPMPGSPAEKAGLLPGDKILEINGESTTGMNLDQAVLKIRGPKGEKVKLLIGREGADIPLEFEIVRAEIVTSSVSSKMLENNIGYLRISSFSETTAKDVEKELDNMMSQDVKGIVIDLRDNPGGIVQTVVDVAEQFVDGGVILYEVKKDGQRKEWTADSGKATDLPVTILVNQNSASGSEVLAGAFQDRGRAKIIGTTTYGKGSVNVLYPLSDGSALYLTIERWLTPNGRPIEGVGLDPDYVVEITADDIAQGKDPQLRKALETLSPELAPVLQNTVSLSLSV